MPDQAKPERSTAQAGDFRSELYRQYVSAFKNVSMRQSDEAVAAVMAWFEHKYLPLFRDLPKDARILELGCGAGNMLAFLQQQGFTNVTGIDLSAEQVALATSRGLPAVEAETFDYLASTRERYHMAIAMDFVEHFSKDELMRLIPAIRNALLPGGRLILQTPNGSGLFPHQVIYGDMTHMSIFTPESLRQLLGAHGFVDSRFFETGPAPKNLPGRVRLLLWRLIRFTAATIRRIETGKTQPIWTENVICECRVPTEASGN